MNPARKILLTGALFGLLTPAAHAVRPSKGDFYNGSSANGGYLIASKSAIKRLSIYCRGNRYDIRERVRIRRGGRFRLRRGTAERYGEAGSPRGDLVRKIRLRGRFVSNDRVRMKRRIPGCDTNTVSISRDD